ncbi:hypothetical protein [Methylocaldum sp.]|nr:hypothetical protein [Methylocaldum sp.]HYE34120.1 hypothetical protein [Methylocaldum sp.]
MTGATMLRRELAQLIDLPFIHLVAGEDHLRFLSHLETRRRQGAR